MIAQKHPVIMTRKDYNLLHPLIAEKRNDDSDCSLLIELDRSIIVTEEAFPAHAIRLNSKVSVLDLATHEVIEFSIVMPDQADSRRNKISILTPMGIALIGFRKAEEVHYRVPLGLKRFRILDVNNSNVKSDA